MLSTGPNASALGGKLVRIFSGAITLLNAADLVTAGGASDRASIVIPTNKWVLARALTFDASADVSVAVFSLRNAAAGAGDALISAVTLTNNAAATGVTDLTVAALTAMQTATTIYFRQTTAAAASGRTVNLAIWIYDFN
jgi:hypothetical protein